MVRLVPVALLAAALSAQAAEPGAGIPQAQVGVIKNRLFHVGGRAELSLGITTAVNARFTSVLGGLAAFDYNFTEWLALEGDGLYGYTSLTDLAQRVREKLKVPKSDATPQSRIGDEVSNMGQMQWGGSLGVRFAPVYGKMSIFAEVPLHFQFYLLAGVGASGLKYESLNFCVARAGPTSSVCNAYRADSAVGLTGQLGLGMRVFLADSIAVKLELRDFIYSDNYLTGVDLSAGSKCASSLTDPACGTAASPGAVTTALFSGGVSYLF